MRRVPPRHSALSGGTGSAILIVLSFAAGCGFGFAPPRPMNLSASAVWVEGVFIECSVNTVTDTNDCSIRDSKGVLLQDGPFLLDNEGRKATSNELRFSAYRDRKIFLQGERFLYPVERIVGPEPPLDSQLTLMAGHGIASPRNCGRIGIGQELKPASDCALKAAADKVPFTVRYALQGYEGTYFYGLAGDRSGNLYAMDDYSFLADVPPVVNEPGNVRYPVRVVQTRCPSPTNLRLTGRGMLTCLATEP
jgi:hypothetical protein